MGAQENVSGVASDLEHAGESRELRVHVAAGLLTCFAFRHGLWSITG